MDTQKSIRIDPPGGIAMAKYIIQQYDKQQRSQQEQSEEAFNEIEGNANNQAQESRWITAPLKPTN